MQDHRHVVGLVMTGPMAVDGEGSHFHLLPGGLVTSTDKDGPKHTHTVGNLETSAPLPILDPEVEDHEYDGAKAKKIKKKKSPKKPKTPSGWDY